ncbi:MAG: PepSY domain-containing protein, partial [Parvibaculaceae bacterium]|nr:PepSY domain-containing protein [Parvibaculaceae bacterium]
RLQEIAPNARRWLIDLPDARDPIAHLFVWRDPGALPSFHREEFNTQTNNLVVARDSYGGDFLFYFHFDLNAPSIWGRLLVGAATIIMLVSMISGIVTHKKIFADFFMLRFSKGQRSWLDAHNVTAVLALPFHLMITYTGLITLMFLYMPWGREAMYEKNQAAFLEEAEISTAVPAQIDGYKPLVSTAPLIVEAKDLWHGAAVGRVNVYRPGKENALIELTSSDAAQIAFHRRIVTFSGATGKLVSTSDASRHAAETRGVMYGLHVGRFAGPTLFWLYVISGLAGTLMIATGLILWTVKRRQQLPDPASPHFGFRLVEKLNITTLIGLPGGIAIFFLCNRLVPVEVSARADFEVMGFFLGWFLIGLWAFLRPPRCAWIETIGASALLFLAVPIISALTTSYGITPSAWTGKWIFVGFDSAMLIISALLGFAGWKVQRHKVKPASLTLSGVTDGQTEAAE